MIFKTHIEKGFNLPGIFYNLAIYQLSLYNQTSIVEECNSDIEELWRLFNIDNITHVFYGIITA